MKKNERISSINSVLRDYFAKHPQSGGMILAKEFMPLFIKNGIFNKDNRGGGYPFEKFCEIWILKIHWTKFPMFILKGNLKQSIGIFVLCFYRL